MPNQALMVVPNTKEGLEAIKYLRKQIVENDILIRLVSKSEFDKLTKQKKCPAHTKVNHCHRADEICVEDL